MYSNSIGLMAPLDAPIDSASVRLIYVDANFPDNLPKWALRAVVFSVSAACLCIICRRVVGFDRRFSLKSIH